MSLLQEVNSCFLELFQSYLYFQSTGPNGLTYQVGPHLGSVTTLGAQTLRDVPRSLPADAKLQKDALSQSLAPHQLRVTCGLPRDRQEQVGGDLEVPWR